MKGRINRVQVIRNNTVRVKIVMAHGKFATMSLIRAEKLKSENIAEYIVHMYQSEDLIMSYKYDLNEINNYVIKQLSKDEKLKKELLLWYASLIEQVQAEKLASSQQRLASTQFYVDELTNLHHALIINDSAYSTIFSTAQISIDSQISAANNTLTNPIQICLNGIYGMLLLRLNGTNISADQSSMLDKFGRVLAYLSNIYRKEHASD